MEVNNILICRFCFKICNNDFDVIKDTVQDMLNLLALNLDLGISRDPVMCNSCIDNLKKCFDFKTECLRKGCRTPLQHQDVAFKASNVCVSGNVAGTGMDFSGSNICRFCMESVKCNSSVLLQNEGNSMMSMLEKYFPALALSPTVDATCIACYNTLQNHLAFISNCLAVEGKIVEYCKFNEVDSKVDLSKVLSFTSECKTQRNVYDSFSKAKMEEACEKTGNGDEVKVKNEHFVKVKEQELCIKTEETRIKMEPNEGDRFDLLHTEHKDILDVSASESTSEVRRYKCATCPFQTKYKKSLERHMITHKSPSEITMYKCHTCAYQAKYKQCFQLHMLTHTSNSEIKMYKCKTCAFQSKHKRSLQVHTLTHKNTAESSFQCKLCAYQSRRKTDIQVHMLVHKNISEVPVYTCEVCAYRTKYKNSLKAHMLTHKNLSEVVSHSCEICAFQTKYKKNLDRHMITHRSTPEVTTYKCKVCAYKTKHKDSLQLHTLAHKRSAQVRVYKCETCAFQTKRKRNLQLHTLTHKSAADLSVHKRELCTYQNRRKADIQIHMLVQKIVSGVPIYTCEVCADHTKDKSSRADSQKYQR